MIKKALEYLVGLKPVEIISIEDRPYSSQELYAVKEPYLPGFGTSTLTSIVDYLKDNPDGRIRNYVLTIDSPTEVNLYSATFGAFEQRDRIITSQACVPSLCFSKFMEKEQFIIELQSKFTKFLQKDKEGNLFETEGDKPVLQKFIGALKSEYVKNHADDGVSQKVEVKTGIATVGEALVPNPVKLAPFRSFSEISQVESDFVFRMRDSGAIEMALFEADGGAWRTEAIQRIKTYFEQQFTEKEIKNVTILA